MPLWNILLINKDGVLAIQDTIVADTENITRGNILGLVLWKFLAIVSMLVHEDISGLRIRTSIHNIIKMLCSKFLSFNIWHEQFSLPTKAQAEGCRKRHKVMAIRAFNVFKATTVNVKQFTDVQVQTNIYNTIIIN